MKRTTAIPAVGVLAIPVANGAARAQEASYPYHMMGGGGWFGGPLMMLVFLAVAVALVVLAVRWLGGGRSGDGDEGGAKSAIAILEERYARGEIDREEFEERKRMLEGR